MTVGRLDGVRTNSRQTDLPLSAVSRFVQGSTGSPSDSHAWDEKRFWARVDKNGPVNPRRPLLGPCWIWTGSTYRHKGQRTYGQTTYRGKRMSAHRASYLMHVGPVPAGLDVMHQCDVKRCVNPAHLRAGTRSENLLDGFASPANFGILAGENSPRAVLTWDKIHAIHAERHAGSSQASLAAKYGVTQAAISYILSGARWPESKCPVHGIRPAFGGVA